MCRAGSKFKTMINHPKKNISVHTWDWKEQPDWESISERINELQIKSQSGISIKYIETKSDEHCIVVHCNDLDVTDDLINNAYVQMYNWEEGKIPDELDWDEAYSYLNDIRMQYTEIGINGMPALRNVIDPLLTRYSNGERTSELFDSIMDLK
jgi:hypothetical protein